MRKFFVRSCVNPDRVLAPGARLRERYFFRRGNWRLPRNFIAKVNSLADRRNKRQRGEERELAQQRRFHKLLSNRRVHDPRVRVKYLRGIVGLEGKYGGGRARRLFWRDVDLEFASGFVPFDFCREFEVR